MITLFSSWRRPSRGLAILLPALLLLLAACGTSTEEDAGADTPEPSASESSYSVEHAMGTTTLPQAPERVVVLDSPHLDALVALGITPVGATESGSGAGLPPYLADSLGGTTVVGDTMEPNLEQIAGLSPDLIIGAKVRHQKLYDRLSAIAPTVFSEDSGTNWREQATVTAAAVDRSEDMEQLLADLDARAAEVGEAVGADGKRVSMVRFLPENFRLYGPDTFSGSLLTQVGFDLGTHEWDQYSMVEASPENYDLIDGDIVFHSTYGEPAASTRGAVTDLWGSLPAVQAGQVHEVEDETWMIGIGIVGANAVLDEIARLLS